MKNEEIEKLSCVIDKVLNKFPKFKKIPKIKKKCSENIIIIENILSLC